MRKSLNDNNISSFIKQNTVIQNTGFDTPCHLWQGTLTADGYGIIWMQNKRYLLHRFVYQQKHGKTNKFIRIECNNRNCINLDHFKLLTRQELNSLIAPLGATALHNEAMEKTHCNNGHKFTDATTYYTGIKRRCRMCDKIRCIKRELKGMKQQCV